MRLVNSPVPAIIKTGDHTSIRVLYDSFKSYHSAKMLMLRKNKITSEAKAPCVQVQDLNLRLVLYQSKNQKQHIKNSDLGVGKLFSNRNLTPKSLFFTALFWMCLFS